jgi:hypothetical protein
MRMKPSRACCFRSGIWSMCRSWKVRISNVGLE